MFTQETLIYVVAKNIENIMKLHQLNLQHNNISGTTILVPCHHTEASLTVEV